MWLVRVPVLVLVAACAGDDPSEDPMGSTPHVVADLQIVTADLAVGETNAVYTAWLEAEGGTPPLAWALEGALPDGLVFNPAAGAISGMTSVSGTFDLDLTVTDAAGVADKASLTLEMVLNADVVPCGGAAEGSFTEAADLDWGVVDWDATGGWQWLEIPLPDESVTRLELAVEPRMTAYLAQPGVAAGTQDLSEGFTFYWTDSGSPMVIDLGTFNDLDTYRSYGEPIRVLLAAYEPFDWSFGTFCSDGPIFEGLIHPPTRLGDELYMDFNVHGTNDGMSFSTADSLPAWVEWDEATGLLTGLAQDVGTWEFDIDVVAPDGSARTEATGLSVYDPVPLACNTPVQITVDEGYYDGELYYWADTRGYAIFEAILPPVVSSATLTVDGINYGTVAFTNPWHEPWWPGSNSDFVWYETGEVVSSPQSWPPIGQVFDEGGGRLAATALPYFGGADLDVLLDCSTSPLPDLPVVPLFEPGVADVVSLPARGGVPPYTWSAAGLPAGLTLAPDGTLTADGTTVDSATSVDFTVVDSMAQQGTAALPVWIGEAQACAGAPILSCGDAVDHTFTQTVFEGPDGEAGFCVTHDRGSDEEIVLTVTTDADADAILGVNHPGHMGTDAPTIYTVFVDPSESDFAVIDALSHPAVDEYAGLPMFLNLRAYELGTVTLAVDCQ